MRVIRCWHRWPREIVRSPSVEIFTLWLDMERGNLLQLPLPWDGGWTRWPSEGPSYPNNPVTLWIGEHPYVTVWPTGELTLNQIKRFTNIGKSLSEFSIVYFFYTEEIVTDINRNVAYTGKGLWQIKPTKLMVITLFLCRCQFFFARYPKSFFF